MPWLRWVPIGHSAGGRSTGTAAHRIPGLAELEHHAAHHWDVDFLHVRR